MITKVKIAFKWALITALIGLMGYSVFLREIKTAFAASNLTSRASLLQYSDNLDLLGDKTGNLNTLVGELQGYQVIVVTGAVIGTTVSVSNVLATDVISEIVVHSSACDYSGSTVIGKAGEGVITLQSRICGLMSTRFNVTFTRKGTTDISSGSLSIGTTGYAFECKLASADAKAMNGQNEISSAAAICAAINSHPWLSKLVICTATGGVTTPSFSTAGFVTEVSPTLYTSQGFYNAVPAPFLNNVFGYQLYKTTTPYQTGEYTLPGSFLTITSSGNIQINTASPIQATDALDLKKYGVRAN